MKKMRHHLYAYNARILLPVVICHDTKNFVGDLLCGCLLVNELHK